MRVKFAPVHDPKKKMMMMMMMMMMVMMMMKKRTDAPVLPCPKSAT